MNFRKERRRADDLLYCGHMSRLMAWLRGLSRPYLIVLAAIVVVVVAGGTYAIIHLRGGASTASAPASVSHVTLASVASLSGAAGPLPVIGTVTSKSQATVLAQSAGEIVSLPHSLGDHVQAGAVIASLDSSSQEAAVQQTQGAYDAAVAALSKAQGATASNAGVTSQGAATAALNARASALTAIASAYASLDDAVHTKADPLFNNPRSVSPTLLPFTVPDSQLVVDVQNERHALEAVLESASTIGTEANPDVDSDIAAMAGDAVSVQSFLDDLIKAVNSAVPNTTETAASISADQAALAAARSEVVGAISSLTSAKGSYDNAQSTAVSASTTASTGTQSDIASAQANLQSALGALNAAKANLAKTAVVAPISGTIVSLPVNQGDYVTAYAEVAELSNPSALEIDTYVTSDDAKTIVTGAEATIAHSIPGTITFVAPALDPSTNKIEVKVGITGSTASLTDGETVSLTLDRAATTAPTSNTAITIPINAAKITPTGPVVFTVSSSTLHALPITLGTILGDTVVVTQGLTPETDIVTDARGLADGQTVVVDQ